MISKKKAAAVGISAAVAFGIAIGPASAGSSGSLKLSLSGSQIVVSDSGFKANEKVGVIANFGLAEAGEMGSRAEDRACGNSDLCTGEDIDDDGAYDYIDSNGVILTSTTIGKAVVQLVTADSNGVVSARVTVPSTFKGTANVAVSSRVNDNGRWGRSGHRDDADIKVSSSSGGTTTTVKPGTTTTTTKPTTTTVKPTTTTVKPTTTTTTTKPSSSADLTDPVKKDIAMQIVSSAENSSLNWKAQYAYIEDIGDGRGYTAGIIGFCSGCGDMQELVHYYNSIAPGNALEKYTAALDKIGSWDDTHAGLGDPFVAAWKTAAKDVKFQQAQDHLRDTMYFNPAVNQAKSDGLRALGQFIYYDAMVMHGPGSDSMSFGGIRSAAMKKAKTPAQGGDEKTYLNAFLDARVAAMKAEEAHEDTTRVDTAQRVWVSNGNFTLQTPLTWKVYGDSYSIK
jgi:chitosanase